MLLLLQQHKRHSKGTVINSYGGGERDTVGAISRKQDWPNVKMYLNKSK